MMRGEHLRQETMFSYMAPEARVPEHHPLRAFRAMVDQALTALDAAFEALYSHIGRPSIPPERLNLGTPTSLAMSFWRPNAASTAPPRATGWGRCSASI